MLLYFTFTVLLKSIQVALIVQKKIFENTWGSLTGSSYSTDKPCWKLWLVIENAFAENKPPAQSNVSPTFRIIHLLLNWKISKLRYLYFKYMANKKTLKKTWMIWVSESFTVESQMCCVQPEIIWKFFVFLQGQRLSIQDICIFYVLCWSFFIFALTSGFSVGFF